jgi:DNA-binding NarL/FixJ family response regulator
VRIVADGGTHISPTLASYFLHAARPSDPATRLDLTDREREILVLVAQGERDEDIAKQLYVGVRTVRSHLEHIRDKTGRRRRPDLTRYAYERGLLLEGPTPDLNTGQR